MNRRTPILDGALARAARNVLLRRAMVDRTSILESSRTKVVDRGRHRGGSSPHLLAAFGLLVACSAPAEEGPNAVVAVDDAAALDATTHDGPAPTEDAPVDSASTDGAMPEASSDVAPSGCTGALCEDFESASLPSTWTIVSPDCAGTGTIALDAAVAHSGKQSLKVSGKGGYCNHVFAKAGVALGPQLYARFYVRMDAALGDGHTTFLALKDSADGGKAMRMGGQNKVLMFNRESDDATLPTMSPTGTAKSKAVTPATWTCIEVHVDQSAGTIETWVDGTSVEGLHENGTPVADVSTQWLSRAWKPTLSEFKLGWESYAGQDMTLHFDDVAISPTRIGCS